MLFIEFLLLKKMVIGDRKQRTKSAKRGFPKKGFAKRARSEAAMPLLHKIGVECQHSNTILVQRGPIIP
jgi:hypothetical protein